MEKTRKRKKVDNKKTLAFKKLKLLITIVNRNKAEYYLDLLQSQEINMQLVSLGKGTADSETLRYLGLAESEKVIIFSIIREDKIPSTLELLNQKFTTIKNGKGIAYTISLSSVIGVAIYQFLSNNTTNLNKGEIYER